MIISLQDLRRNKDMSVIKTINDINFIDDKDLKNFLINFNIKLVGNIVLINGFIKFYLHKNCEKCLENFDFYLTCDFDRDYIIDEKQITLDLHSDINDEYWLNIPIVYICNAQCNGICQFCGVNLNKQLCECNNIKN